MNAPLRALRRAIGAAAAITIAASSCGGVTQPAAPASAARACPPMVVTVSVMTSTQINPTSSGAARPVALRVYQLKSDVGIQSASYESVWNESSSPGAPKDDVVARVVEESVLPETRTDFVFKRHAEATSLAVLALFREPTGRGWLATFELPEVRDGECPRDPAYAVWLEGGAIEPGDARRDRFPTPTRVRAIGVGAAPDEGAPKKVHRDKRGTS